MELHAFVKLNVAIVVCLLAGQMSDIYIGFWLVEEECDLKGWVQGRDTIARRRERKTDCLISIIDTIDFKEV